MRKVNNIKWQKLSILPILAMLFFTANLYAQNAVTVSQNDDNQLLTFIEVDTDNDGFVTQSELDINNFAEFDKNNDGKLSRMEYRTMKRGQNKGLMANAKQGSKKGNNKSIKGKNGKGNKKGQGTKSMNGKKKGNQNGNGSGNCQKTCNGQKNNKGGKAGNCKKS